jgi:hypothetical protein
MPSPLWSRTAPGVLRDEELVLLDLARYAALLQDLFDAA